MSGFVAASAFALSIGALVGFIFSSNQGEENSVGKVRDWLLGGITGLAIAEAARQGESLELFFRRFVVTGHEIDFSTVLALFAYHGCFGFFAMYYTRELILNRELMRSRRDIERLAQVAASELNKADSQQSVGEKIDREKGMVPSVALSEPVQELVRKAEKMNVSDLPGEGVEQVANALYHQERYEEAIPYFKRLLELKPKDFGAAMKLAVCLGDTGRRAEAVNILGKIVSLPGAPAEVHKLLGYYLLWFPERLEESIKESLEYLKYAPADGGSLLNIACAYAQLYGRTRDGQSKEKALQFLSKAIATNTSWRQRATELMDQDFSSLRNDPEFQSLVLLRGETSAA